MSNDLERKSNFLLDEKGNVANRASLSMGTVPNIYKQFGSNGKSLYIHTKVVAKIIGKDIDDHDIPISELKQIPNKLTNPLYIFKGNSPNSNSIVPVIDMVDNQGRQIIVPMLMNVNSGNVIIDVVTSVYGRNNFKQYVVDQINKGNLLYTKK